MGKKSLSSFQNKIINWNVVYNHGTLKVTGYKNGAAVSESSLKTTGEAYAIKTDVIKDDISKSGVVQIPLSIVDKDGNIVYAADNEVTVSVNGKAVLLGLESGSSSSREDYKSNRRITLHGRMIAYVLLEKNAGKVLVEFSAPELQTTKLLLND